MAQYTYFSDNFDNKANPLDAPQVGFGYSSSGSTGSPFSLSTNPALGTQSLHEVRDAGGDFGNLLAIGLNGVLVDQNTITFSWDEYITYLYNAPVQVHIGYTPLSTGGLEFVGINDNPGGAHGTFFFYQDQNGDQVSTGVKPTLNGWDHLSMTLNLSEYYVPGGPNYMTGTMTSFTVSQNSGPTQTLASNIALPYAQIPTLDPLSPYDNSSAAVMLFTEGPSGSTYYDNITLTGADAPAPPIVHNLTWNNAGTGTHAPNDGITWDVDNSSNWVSGTDATAYSQGDNVTFNDSNNNNYAVTLNTTVKPGSVTVDNSAGNYTISGTGTIGGTGSLTKSGTGKLSLSTANTYSGGTIVNAGVLEVFPTSATTSALPKGAVTINGGTLQLATNVTAGSQASPAPASNVNITSLSISGNGTLDIGNNHIIIDYTPGNDPMASIAMLIKSGYAAGAWTGTGITSSSAQTNSGSYGIGYADSADPGNPAGLSSGQIEIEYTLLGDANLDGKVNGADFAILAANFNKSVSGASGWDQGDFNYDGKINGADFAFLAANFNKGASQSADLAAVEAFASSNGLIASVP
jgi:autotransporter-associated beta strand protein